MRGMQESAQPVHFLVYVFKSGELTIKTKNRR